VVNYVGNNANDASIVAESLEKLKTSYVDLLYAHWWDWETNVEEVMRGLHKLVMQSKVLYLVRDRVD
jgi:aryl-alcohol dehydrogenase-like predicted oxidoreductase